ncbi:urease subunit beta [Halobacillus shinanisalinarum]|uniref:Urease subunit beta n=1 Tax=Halobacillus shinanisalinarum TaxID=2932258 RepID=A0ABY4H6Y4_9BACI|nr:urease subunit beta [Halobacillus shinanisalinarum]UOQ94747.1 urease subunit beta [Halobacillus shinanisalinarum]
MIPGEYKVSSGDIEINPGRQTKTIRVANTGDRPIQVGSHYHFIEANKYLSFPREETVGMQLNIPAGTAVRFEPGEEKEVELTEISGRQNVYGLNDLTGGSTDNEEEIIEKADKSGFKGVDDE